MILIIFLTLVPRILSMNPIGALGHSTLWKKYALKPVPPPTIIKLETPQSSPPQPMNKSPSLCSPLSSSCLHSPQRIANVIDSDTPKSLAVESLEEHHQSSLTITLVECLREKKEIDRLLTERAQLGLFLFESTDRPVINNITVFKESVKAIRAQVHRKLKDHLNDNTERIEEEYRCYGLNHIDIIAIRLYTTVMAFVVNQALRNYFYYQIQIPTAFLPYIYTLINALNKLDRDRQMTEDCGFEGEPFEVARYIPLLNSVEKTEIQPILDAHQPGVYVIYPAFTSSSDRDLAKGLWSDGFEYRFEIKARTAIPIENFAVNQNEYEIVFFPGSIFHILERDDPYVIMEEITIKKLMTKRDQLPC